MDDAHIADASARMEPIVRKVADYGDKHSDEFGSVGVAWDGATATVVASFTGNLATHRDALRRIVGPRDLTVCRTAISALHAQALADEFAKRYPGRVLSTSLAFDAVEVALAPGETKLAADFHQQYGDALRLTIGTAPFPPDVNQASCPDPPTATQTTWLTVALKDVNRPVIPTANGLLRFDLQLTNLSAQPVSFPSVTAVGTILNEGGDVVATSDGLALPTLGTEISIEPGASQTVELVANVVGCGALSPSVLPAGRYSVVAHIPNTGVDPTMIITRALSFTLGR